jgi:hypothetical protein
MEGTGVYWNCVHYALEGEFELLLVNAAHVKQVPSPDRVRADASATTYKPSPSSPKGTQRDRSASTSQ